MAKTQETVAERQVRLNRPIEHRAGSPSETDGERVEAYGGDSPKHGAVTVHRCADCGAGAVVDGSGEVVARHD